MAEINKLSVGQALDKLRGAEAPKTRMTRREVMAMVTTGFLNKQTAAKIGLSEVTVKVHRHNVMKKLGAKSLPELVRIADSLVIGKKSKV